jgi:hypothetical protein
MEFLLFDLEKSMRWRDGSNQNNYLCFDDFLCVVVSFDPWMVGSPLYNEKINEILEQP